MFTGFTSYWPGMDFYLNVAVGYLGRQKHKDQYLLPCAVVVAPVGSCWEPG
jgi:hypothetical protein